MGWFNKKEEGMHNDSPAKPLPQRTPSLPSLPPLREPQKEKVHQLPQFPNSQVGQKISQNTIKDAVTGKKNAPRYSAEKESDKAFDANDFGLDKKRMMPQMPVRRKPLSPLPLPEPKKPYPRTKEIEEDEEENTFDFEDFDETDEKPEDLPDFDETDFDDDLPDADEEEDDFEPPKEMYRPSVAKRKEPVFIRIDKFETSLKAIDKTKRDILEMEKMIKDIAKLKEEEEKQINAWQKDILKIKDQIARVDEDIFSKLE